MLNSLRIQNLALIDDLTLEFGEGLNLLTGETGSGKSIIVDAVGLVLGRRSASELIRGGAEAARVEAVMDIGPAARRYLDDAGIASCKNEEPVVLRREISRSGKGRAWINQSPVTVGFLQELAPLLADIHGQHDQQLLQQPGLHVDLLDNFAEAQDDRARVGDAYRMMAHVRDQLHSAESSEHQRQQRLDFLGFQTQEIADAQLQAGEEENLVRERHLLSHREELQRLSREIYEWLYNQDDSALSLLARASRNLQRLAAIDPTLEELQGTVQSCQFSMEDLAYRMRDYGEASDFDPSRLQQVELRLDRIDRLKRKYGGSVPEILELHTRLEEEYARLQHWEENRQKLVEALAAAEREYEDAAVQLSEKRRAAALRMQKAMESELKHLAMERSRFVVSVHPGEATRKGKERVELLISPNVGEEPRPLARIASGGELSRLMLALKTTLRSSGEELLVFDEVDSGIGGRVAETVGLKLKKLASRQQVFCVTHLPQIAAFADVHFRVEKEVRKGRTLVAATRLSPQGKLEEVARMLAGAQVGKSALDHARELISRASV